MDMIQAVVNPDSHIEIQALCRHCFRIALGACGISKTYGKVVASGSSCGKGKCVVSGIFGYIGTRHPFEVLLRGLREVQHKGYDSCGIAIVSSGETKIVRAVGGVSQLETKLKQAEPIVKELAWGIGETL